MASIEKRKLKNGETTYRIKVSLGYNEEGKQVFERSDVIRFGKEITERQVKRELNKMAVLFEEQIKSSYNNLDRRMDNHIKFKDLADEWLALIEDTAEQKSGSIERLKSCRYRTYMAIGDTEVRKITYRQIQQFIVSLSREGVNQHTGGGLSAKTQKHYIWFVSDVMKYAMKCGLIVHNPCRGISVTKNLKKEKDIYSLDELKCILETINEYAPTDYKVFISLLAYLGLRRGEVLGLEYKDFDFDNKLMSVIRTSNYRNKNTGVYTGSPKTMTSNRVLVLPDIVLNMVKQLRNEQLDQSIKCGDLWNETDRLFVTWCGKPMHPNTPYTWLKRFCEIHSLPFKGLHAFRHTFATQAITHGTDVATVSSVLGHSQTSTTLNLYTHAVQSANAKAVDVVASLIGR